jgi:hypothetical protein
MKEPMSAQWFIYPQTMVGSQGIIQSGFEGLVTQNDPTFVSDTSAVAGQNVFDMAGDHFSVRPYGTAVYPSTATVSTASGGYKTGYSFRLRDGSNIILVATDTTLEFFDELSQTFVNLLAGQTSGDYGFAEFNVNTNAESRIYFGNGVDNSGYWNGGHTLLNGALVGGEATINIDSAYSFLASGTVRIGTTNVTYTGITATSLTGCVGTPASADNTPISQAVTTSASYPVGNVLMAAHNRLFWAPSNNHQMVYFSAYGDSTSWSSNTVLSSTATNAGAFNLIEGGGQVKAMSQDEASLYFFKGSMIYSANLTDSFYSLNPFKPFDGRSRAVGAQGRRGVFIGGNSTFVCTPDNQVKSLQRVQYIDYPQLKPISYPIQPTCNNLDFSSVAGICFKQWAFIACKSSVSATNNDTVLVYNTVEEHWETPIVGWQVGEWFIYNDGEGESLFFTDAISPNIWKLVTNVLSDGPYQISASRSTKQYAFGSASEQKEFDDIFVEGYISPSSSIDIELLLDEKGFTGNNLTTFSGSETDYQLNKSTVNSFGLTPFATERFGSNDDLTGLRKFRVHLKNDLRRVPFYVAQLKFSSSGYNQRWEIIRYGFLVRPHSQPTRTKLMRSFN